MVRFIKRFNGDAGQRYLRLEQMAAEWRGEVLTEIFVVPTRVDEAFGDNGAYLIFKPSAALKTNNNTAGKITPETLSTAENDDSAAEVSKG